MLGVVVNVRPPVVAPAVKRNVNVCPASSAGPGLMLLAKFATETGPTSSFTAAGLPASVKLGGSLTGVTVIVKVCGSLVSTPFMALPPLSFSVTVMFAVPCAPAAIV